MFDSMISMVARVNRTFAHFGESERQNADNHAGNQARDRVRPLECFNCRLEPFDEFSSRRRRGFSLSRSGPSQSDRIAQGARSRRVTGLFELFHGERADEGVHHGLRRAHHIRNIFRGDRLAGCLKAHKKSEEPRQKEPDSPARVECRTSDARGGRGRHGLSVGWLVERGIS